jgi:NDP-sugar pyrophosphorylase family protein
VSDEPAGVALAAGEGRRLRPLTNLRPKALCPVATRPLVDHALDRLAGVAGSVAVNLHHGVEQLDAHLPTSVHRSFEWPLALGTAGALGALNGWIGGRDVLVTNVDAWFEHPPDLAGFVDEWDRERSRLLCVRDPERGDFGDLRYCGVALVPAEAAADLTAEPTGLYEVLWAAEHEAGRLDLVVHDGIFVDCGTAADYLRANVRSARGEPGSSVVDPTAVVGAGARIERSVVWDHSEVAPGEVLEDAIRAGHLTILVR